MLTREQISQFYTFGFLVLRGVLSANEIATMKRESLEIFENIESALDVDAIYLNAPRTAAHINLLKSRNSFNLKINSKFMSSLRPHCIVLDPMQRSEDFEISVQDNRLAFYRQAENALYVRMGVVLNLSLIHI